MKKMQIELIVLIFPILVTSKGLKISQIKLPSSHHVKYMPAGYKEDSDVTACPAPSQSTSGSGQFFYNAYPSCYHCHEMKSLTLFLTT